MWVVKLGGSLAGTRELPSWLDVLARFGRGKVVIVPGGGTFADQVRRAQEQWGFSDDTAHHMALLAMDQYALMMAGIRPELSLARSRDEIEKSLRTAGLPLWLPSRMVLDDPGIPASWDVTSDSLAAWLAREIGARALVLVKSVLPCLSPVSAPDLCACGLVDRAFPGVTAAASYEIRIMEKTQLTLMRQMLSTGTLDGTAVTSDNEAGSDR